MEQEQIEEMAKFMHYITRKKDKDCEKTKCEQCWCSCKDDAERLYNAGYRIKPKKAVTIPAEEKSEEMKEINKTLAERDELKAEIERLKEVIADQNELCWNCKKSVKEFAEKLRKKVISLNVWEFGEIDVIDVDDIDELLKEYEK